MTNWVYNYIIISHKNTRKIEAFVRKCAREMQENGYGYDSLFYFLNGKPNKIEIKENGYHFFNKIAGERAFVRYIHVHDDGISLRIDSAYEPIHKSIKALTDRKYGFTLERGTYCEDRMNFCGDYCGEHFKDFDNLNGIPIGIICDHSMYQKLEEERNQIKK